jgi:hypothetical protein
VCSAHSSGLAVAAQLRGVDSLPGLSVGRVDRIERWFPHTRAVEVGVSDAS